MASSLRLFFGTTTPIFQTTTPIKPTYIRTKICSILGGGGGGGFGPGGLGAGGFGPGGLGAGGGGPPISWDPEGILGTPQTGHIARREFQKRLEGDAEAREAFERQILEEKERIRALREARVVPDAPSELIEYFLDTQAREFDYEISRLRPRLNQEFFSHLKFELGQLRFAVSKTQDMEDRLIELEALEKALLEGTEAYDKMQVELVKAKESLTKIFTSKDIKATLLDMVERNELNRSLLTLLDENIASAQMGNQVQAAAFMEKLRGAMLKYITV